MVLGVATVLGAIAIPQAFVSIDSARAIGAARFVSSRLMQARAQAVQRSTSVAIRFATDASGVQFATYQDGNHNGVRTLDIDRAIDRQVEPPVGLFELFPGVDFGLTIDGRDQDPIQLGGTSLLTFTPAGTATSGSLYLKGRHGAQFAIRVLGATGRARVQRYDDRQRTWTDEW
jgi:Tfp pilus assembly protein FimT